MDKETELLEALKAGNEKAFEVIYNQYLPSLMTYACSIINADVAEDIIQEVFLRVWEHRQSLLTHRSIKAFLFSMVYSRCVDQLRRSAMVERYAVHVQEESDKRQKEHRFEKNKALERLYRKDFYKRLRLLMKQQPDQRNKIFIAAYMRGMKAKEIAERLEMPVRTVENHLYLAVKFLKKKMVRSQFLP